MKAILKGKLLAALSKSESDTNKINDSNHKGKAVKPLSKLAKSKPTKSELDRKAVQPKTAVIQPKLQQVTQGKVVKSKKGKLSTLQEKMARKLSGSKFRWINETLYTTPSTEAFRTFQADPELFEIYHTGFSTQVDEWPVNPIDIFITYLETKSDLVVADMGCGTAKIAQTATHLKVHSFDLIAGNEYITACDIAKVPLAAASVDITIFALSLMGTNFVDFLRESFRIMKTGGELLIAEVVSRIEDLDAFVRGVEAIGFQVTKRDSTNRMFVLLNFVKIASTLPSIDLLPTLKPCLYKRR